MICTVVSDVARAWRSEREKTLSEPSGEGDEDGAHGCERWNVVEDRHVKLPREWMGEVSS